MTETSISLLLPKAGERSFNARSPAESRDPETITARALTSAIEGESAPREFMWMPGGVHTIDATKGEDDITLTVLVDRQTAATAQSALDAIKGRGRKPYFDFEHREREASAWPLEFNWREQPVPGVYVTAEWSKTGEENVVGKVFRGFSPAFRVDKYVTSPESPARVKGLPLVMGGLTNIPAFKDNLPLWARASGGAVDKQTKDMDEKELAALKAKLETLETEIATIKASKAAGESEDAIKARNADLVVKQSEARAAKAEIAAAESAREVETLKADIKARNGKAAEEAVKAAVKRGAIAPQDEKLQARYRGLIEADPENITLLEALPSNPALNGETITAGASRVTIGDEDIRRVVRAYGDEKDSLKRGVIWARDMRKRLDNEWDGIIRAANSLGTLAGNLVTQRSLDLLKYEFPSISRISIDFSPEPVNYGQEVDCRLRSVPAVGDYNPATGYPTEDATATDVPITINKHKSVQHSFTVNDLASTRRLLFPEQEEGMHFALGNQLMTDLLALITAGNFGNATVCALADMARKTVVALKTALVKRKVMGGLRTALLSSDYYGALEADTTIVSALINPQAGTAIGTSTLPPIAGFTPFDAPYLPTAGNLVGAAFRADALAMAARLPNDYSTVFPGVTGGGVVQTVTNPDTGLSVMLVMFIDHKLGAALIRVALMYGVAKGNPDCLQRLTSA